MNRYTTKNSSKGKTSPESSETSDPASRLMFKDKFKKSFEAKLFGTYCIHEADGGQVDLLFFKGASHPGAASTNNTSVEAGQIKRNK